MTILRIAPWQFACLHEGIHAARSAGYSEREAIASGIIYAGLPIRADIPGEYEIIIDWCRSGERP